MKIIDIKDTPENMKEILDLAHKLAEEAYPQVWDALIKDTNEIKEYWTGNQFLSIFTTCIYHFAGRWIQSMCIIADADHSGISHQEIFNNVFEAVAHAVSLKIPLKNHEPSEIKRLSNKMND